MEYKSPELEILALRYEQVLCTSNQYDGVIDELEREDIENW